MSFKLEQAETGIALGLTPDTLCVETVDGVYLVTFQSGADTVRLKLSADLLSILGLQCIAHLPQIAPDRPISGLEDSYRLSAQLIKSLDNRSLQCLLRECQSETIVCFLWYMKDGDLIRQIFRNMSQRAAELMIDDLEQNWRGRNPDQSSGLFTQQGRAAVLKILGLARQLAGEGLISAPETSLTPEEIDALLSGVTEHEKPADNKAPMTFTNAYIAWLACLGCLLHRVRCEGLMSIECLIETPREEGNLFGRFPQVLEEPYLRFATDVLRMMVGGSFDPDDMQVYVNHAVAFLTAVDDPASVSKVDPTLLETIWLTLWAGMKGYVPQVAVEFGRQAVPVKAKPTHGELLGVFREVRNTWRESQLDSIAMENRIESFIKPVDLEMKNSCKDKLQNN